MLGGHTGSRLVNAQHILGGTDMMGFCHSVELRTAKLC